jgi:glycerophosphoryl diester phosphodiesterase
MIRSIRRKAMSRHLPLCIATTALLLAAPPAVAGTHADAIIAAVHDRSARAPVIVVAHRGCWRETAENSIAGIKRCIAAGVDVVELDVRLSADGVPVLMHDTCVARTTNGEGDVRKLSAAALRALRLKAGMGGADAPLTKHRIPTFREAMIAAKGRILVNVDLKDAAALPAIMAVLRETGTTRQVIMKLPVGLDAAALAAQPFLGKTMFMPIVAQCRGKQCSAEPGVAASGYSRFDPIGFEIVYRDQPFFDSFARTVPPKGPRLWVNTLGPSYAAGVTDAAAEADPDGNWGRLVAQGASMIQTDRPEALVVYLRKRGKR